MNRLHYFAILFMVMILAGCVGGSNPLQTTIATPEPTPTASVGPEPLPPLVISPATASVIPSGTLTFSGAGGAPAYTFALTTNLTGGRIDPASGVYQAGRRAASPTS